MENQLSETIVLGDGEQLVVDETLVAPVGEPAVDIPGNDAQLIVESTGSILAPDEGNTAVQVSGVGDIIRNGGEISGSFNGVSSTGERLNLINQGTITSDSRAVDFVARK